MLHVHATTYMSVLHEHAVYYGPHGWVYTACRAKSCDSANSQRQFEKIAIFFLFATPKNGGTADVAEPKDERLQKGEEMRWIPHDALC
jgi:hypothetical protein